nr:MAG TPA: hypothetical protein [Bacteriophage sp.]
MQYATKTELLWWTIVVMGRRTSPSSYEKQLSLIISPDVRRGLFVMSARNTVLQK